MTKLKLVHDLNLYLQPTDFKINACGNFGLPLKSLKKDDQKYIQIINKHDEDCCYMDWTYDDFNAEELKNYAMGIDQDQGFGDDAVAKEYKQLQEWLLNFFNLTTNSN